MNVSHMCVSHQMQILHSLQPQTIHKWPQPMSSSTQNLFFVVVAVAAVVVVFFCFAVFSCNYILFILCLISHLLHLSHMRCVAYLLICNRIPFVIVLDLAKLYCYYYFTITNTTTTTATQSNSHSLTILFGFSYYSQRIGSVCSHLYYFTSLFEIKKN